MATYVTLHNVRVLRISEQAYLLEDASLNGADDFADGANRWWVPKSQAQCNLQLGETGQVRITEWLANKKGLLN